MEVSTLHLARTGQSIQRLQRFKSNNEDLTTSTGAIHATSTVLEMKRTKMRHTGMMHLIREAEGLMEAKQCHLCGQT